MNNRISILAIILMLIGIKLVAQVYPVATRTSVTPPYPYSLSGFVDDLDEPTFRRVRRQQAANESSGSIYKGYKGMVIDNNDLDVPTFLRRKAD